MVDRYINHRFRIDCFHTAFNFSYGEDFIFRGERHDFAEVTLVTSGKMIITQEENVYALESGGIIVHAPMEFHRLRAADGTRPTGYTISFHTDGDLPCELFDGIFTLDREAVSEYETIMERLIPFVDSGEGGELEGQYLADALSAFFIKLCGATHANEVTKTSAREYNKVVSDMSLCVYDGYDLATFAKRASISVSYLKLLFTKYAGVSPKSYYSALRAKEAARLLRHGYSATEIAARMNFASASYFSLFFKKHYGITPQKYKSAGNQP